MSPIIRLHIMIFIISVTSLSAVHATDTISRSVGSSFAINSRNISNGEDVYLFNIFKSSYESGMTCLASWIEGKENYYGNDGIKFIPDQNNQVLFKIENLKPSDACYFRVEVVLTGSNIYLAKRYKLLIDETTVIPTSQTTTSNKEIDKTATEPNNHNFSESITKNNTTRTGHNNNPVDDTCNKTNLIIALSIVSILLGAILTCLLVNHVHSKQYQRVPITRTV